MHLRLELLPRPREDRLRRCVSRAPVHRVEIERSAAAAADMRIDADTAVSHQQRAHAGGMRRIDHGGALAVSSPAHGCLTSSMPCRTPRGGRRREASHRRPSDRPLHRADDARWSSAPASTRPASRTSIIGCVTETDEQGSCVARSAVLAAGWPIEVPGVTLNRFCGSGQTGGELRRARRSRRARTTSSTPAASRA